MILTITPNPTIDRIYYLPHVRPNWVHRAVREVATPSGKGVDISIILHLLGAETTALGFNAGLTGRLLCGMLDEQGVAHDFVEAAGETRTVPVLVDGETGAEYTITAPTLAATPAHLDELLQKLEAHSEQAWGVACAGSLPKGVSGDSYATIIRAARAHGLITLMDVSGDALRAGLAGLPHILKINVVELATFNPDFAEDADVIAAADVRSALDPFRVKLRYKFGSYASDAVVISLGTQGVVAVTDEGDFYAPALDVPVGVTNGAGDAMDAGILLSRQRGEGWGDALRLGTACAAAAVMHGGTSGCDASLIPRLLERIESHELQ